MYYAINKTEYQPLVVEALRDRSAALALVNNPARLKQVVEIYKMPEGYRLGNAATINGLVEKIQRDGKAMQVHAVKSASAD